MVCSKIDHIVSLIISLWEFHFTKKLIPINQPTMTATQIFETGQSKPAQDIIRTNWTTVSGHSNQSLTIRQSLPPLSAFIINIELIVKNTRQIDCD